MNIKFIRQQLLENLYQWKPVAGYEGLYEVNQICEVRSLHKRTNGLLKSRVDRAMYRTVRLNKDGKSKTYYVHRLAAAAFIPNPENKSFVNHLNGNKLDNRIENLQWVSHVENIQHAYQNNLIATGAKPVYDSSTGRIFRSSKEAAEHYQIKYNTLRNYLNGNISRNPTTLKYITDMTSPPLYN